MSKKSKAPKISKAPKAPNKAPVSTAKPRRKYSDSRERILNNLQKMQGSCKLIRNRFTAWTRAMDPNNKTTAKLGDHLSALNQVDTTLVGMYEELHSLLEGFEPPKAVFKTTFETGDAVALAPKYKDRYERVYEADFDALEIAGIDQHDGHTDYILTDGSVKFLVPAKSHLVHVKDRDL